jgi:transcriptional regulator with XRE-family HTH domain
MAMLKFEKENEKDHSSSSAHTLTTVSPEDGIGQRISQKRVLKALNHDGLAKLTKLVDQPSGLGISRTTIRGYELDISKPGTRELRLLSQALETTPNWLIYGGNEADGATGQSVVLGKTQHPTELQKFLVAAHLLRSIEPSDRDVVYGVLHSIARLKHGENEYRAGVIPVNEIGALIGDIWDDLKSGHPVDQEKMQEMIKAYGPYIEAIVEKETGQKLSDIIQKK